MNEWDILAKRLNAEREQQEAAQRLAALQNTQQQNERPGGIAGVLAGIGESIGNFGDTLYNMGGTGIASIRDLVTGNAGTGKYQNEWKQYRKEQAGNPEMSDKDYYLKTGAKALDAAATASDFIPGLGTGAKVALNVGQGVVSGGARELIDNGENANLNNVLIGAAAGGLGSAAGQAVGGKLAKNAISNPAKSAIGKAAQSAIGRGAITGAVSGAVGGGVGSTLAGGNTLEGALQGASSGALGGATTSAIYGLAGNALNKAKGKLEDSWAAKAADKEAKAQAIANAEDVQRSANKSTPASTGASRDVADLKNYASKKVDDFLAKNGGMASDGEINGVYEDAFIKEATRAGLDNLEINNALNEALRTNDVDYMRSRTRLAEATGGSTQNGESGAKSVNKKSYIDKAIKRGASMQEINSGLNEALGTDGVDYINSELSEIVSKLNGSEISSAQKEKLHARYKKLDNLRTADSWKRLYERANNKVEPESPAKIKNDDMIIRKNYKSDEAYYEDLVPALDEAKWTAFKTESDYYKKNNLGKAPDRWSDTGDTFGKAYVKKALSLGVDADTINEELNFQKDTNNVDYVKKVNSAAPAGGDGTVPTKPTTQAEGEIPAGTKRRQTPMGWNDENLSGAAKKQNYLQKLGGDLQGAAQATRDSAIYSKLKGNTADEMVAKDAIGNLRKNYGYSPDDYEQASKLSTAINKWYDNEIQSSGAEKINTKLSSDLALPDNNTLPEKYEKAYNATLKNAMNMANAGDSDVIDKYTASGLERAAKYLGEQEQKMRRTNMNGVGGRPDGDRAELADYYKNARQILRNEVNSMIELDDITKNNLSKLLDNAGATEQAKKAILSAKTFSEVKSATAPLEDARTMNRQMKSSALKRSAAGDNSVNVTTQIANKTGLNNLLDVAGKPIRSGAAAVENTAGKAISAVGNAIAGDANGVPGKVVGGIANVARTAATAPNLNIGPIDMDTIVNRQIARQSAVNAGNAPLANQRAAAASQALSEAQTAYNTANANLAAAQNAASPAISNGAQQLTTIKNAMQLALNAGDLASYQKLSDLYSEAYKIYGEELQQTNPMSQLTSSQIENINKLDTAGNAIDELEALFQKAGGGQGLVGGNAANFMAALGLNSDVSTYNALSRGLVNQIGAAIGKTDSLNTEGEVNRALELIPKFTDDAQTAQNKLEQLRQMLATNKQTVYANYGLTQ